MSLSRRFYKARKAKDWTLAKAAEKAGLSVGIVNNAETQQPSKLHTVLVLCRVYDIPLDEMAQLYWSEVNHEHHQPAGTVRCTGRGA